MPAFAVPPSSLYAAFDPVAFDFAFAIFDAIPVFNKTIIPRGMQKVEAGQAIAIMVQVQTVMSLIGERFNFNPDHNPDVQLYNPDGTVKVAWSSMNYIGNVGYYIYQHQTIQADQVGSYSGRFRATNGSMTALSDLQVLFTVTVQ